MGDWDEDEEERVAAAFFAELEREELSPAGIADSNRHLLERQWRFRRAADIVVAAVASFDEIEAIALFGSVAGSLRKEVPRFRNYRRARIALWHECGDVDLAVQLHRLDRLRPIRQAMNRALIALHGETGIGVASHQLDVFLFAPGTDRYLGRLCEFKRCLAGQRDCLALGCGATPFLKQHAGFALRRNALDHAVRLFEREAGILRRAVDLPMQDG